MSREEGVRLTEEIEKYGVNMLAQWKLKPNKLLLIDQKNQFKHLKDIFNTLYMKTLKILDTYDDLYDDSGNPYDDLSAHEDTYNSKNKSKNNDWDIDAETYDYLNGTESYDSSYDTKSSQ